MNTEIPIGSLNHFVYCPHRFWRLFCAGEFVDNHYTIEGAVIHSRVHTLGDSRRGETLEVRGIWLRSEKYGLIGKADLVEVEDGSYIPVEYKRGERGEYDNDAIQLCAQALCLEEMTNKKIEKGFVYYASSHQREEVIFSESLRQETIGTIVAIRELFETGKMPPAIYSNRCKGCSLFLQCLPKAVAKISKYKEE